MNVAGTGMRVVVAKRPVDFRKGHDGLAAVVEHELGLDPYSGVAVVFRPKRMDRMKVLWWDGTGLVLATKRLEQGRFACPRHRMLDEPSRQLLGQRCRGELLCYAENRAHPPRRLPQSSRSKGHDLRVHRGVLQSATSPLDPRLPDTSRLRADGTGSLTNLSTKPGQGHSLPLGRWPAPSTTHGGSPPQHPRETARRHDAAPVKCAGIAVKCRKNPGQEK